MGAAVVSRSVLHPPLVPMPCITSNDRFLKGRRTLWHYAGLLLLLLFPATYCHAQFDSAEVLGAVKDPSGAVVSGAKVVLTNPAKGITVTRQADASGDYDFTNVQPGGYTVTVQATGFRSSVTDPLRLMWAHAASRHRTRKARSRHRKHNGFGSGKSIADRYKRPWPNHSGGRSGQVAPEWA